MNYYNIWADRWTECRGLANERMQELYAMGLGVVHNIERTSTCSQKSEANQRHVESFYKN